MYEPGQIVCVRRCMLHPSGISTIEVGFKLIDVKIFQHCTEVEKGVGEEMIHLFGAIINT